MSLSGVGPEERGDSLLVADYGLRVAGKKYPAREI
jgi:hypothetical protein